MIPENIEIRGARENNLKNIDVNIPLYKSTVVVGVSGSGKSSLVYDTLYNESQRAFLEHLSINSNNLMLKSPAKVDSINHLPAAFSVSQHSHNNNPRSTIGTFTDLSDFLRSLFAYVTKFERKVNLKPNDFSFNNPSSSCSLCKGLGKHYKVDINLVIPYPDKSLLQHAILFFKGNEKSLEFQTLSNYCEDEGIAMDKTFNELDQKEQKKLLYGVSDRTYNIRFKTLKKRYKQKEVQFRGAILTLEELLEDIDTPSTYRSIQKYLTFDTCPKCKGLRLGKEMLSYFVNDLNISEVEHLDINELEIWLGNVKGKYSNTISSSEIQDIVTTILNKVKPMKELSLDYLSMNRSIPSLSGGELQRLRIANQLNNPLIGLLYIFDEPSKGLHVKDIDKIIAAANGLVEKGNTVVSIEHNEHFIDSMDNQIFIGLGGGKYGGQIISKKDYLADSRSLFDSRISIEIKNFVKLININYNNLKKVDVNIPKKGITVITGVSGSGKSSLITVIEQSVSSRRPIHCDSILGHENIKRVFLLNQKPIHNNSRSSVVSYLGIFDEIRDMYASLDLSKEKNYSASYFSPNVSGGRCEVCSGQGETKVDISFLEDMYIKCEECNGTGFKEEILEIKYRGYDIVTLLNTEIQDIISLFNKESKVFKKLQVLIDLGMDYIKLGQASSTLSGGEAQRIKLAKVLGERFERNAMFLLDEPTSGLSEKDVVKFTEVINKIAIENIVVVIEHNITFVKNIAHYLIDFGSTAGKSGGIVNVQGVLPDILKNERISFM